jgi:alanine racemase
MPSYAPSRLTVDLKAVAENYKKLKSMVTPECGVAGMVKANAYGLGMEQIAPLLDRLGCPLFFTATLDEALFLRALTHKPVAVLEGLLSGAETEYVTHNLIPVMNSPEEIGRRTYSGPSIWHIDTGMNRLGLRPEDVTRLMETGQPPFMIMSHFACADEEGHPLTAKQAAIFNEVAMKFPALKRSLCNSSGMFRNSAWHGDMVRPGMALYGLNPTPEHSNPMKQTVRLEARLLQVKTAGSRETVGYGATYTLPRDSAIGIVAIGYADGLLRSGSNSAYFYWQGHPCPVIGRISMDLIAVDLGELEMNQPLPHPGDWIEVMGPHQSPYQLALSCGTIGYEILTSLGHRAERIYLAS